jgi:hypothetical protein
MGEAKWKQTGDASDAENAIPGSHGPGQAAERIMRAMLETCTDVFPGYTVKMFVFEPRSWPIANTDAAIQLCVDRPTCDMIAVLKAFIAGQEREGTKLDRIDVEPPAGAPNTGGETTTGDGVVYA